MQQEYINYTLIISTIQQQLHISTIHQLYILCVIARGARVLRSAHCDNDRDDWMLSFHMSRGSFSGSFILTIINNYQPFSNIHIY